MNKKAFTLLEIIVAVSIFMIVMVSVLQIFSISLDLTNKIDINRQMQENVKNVTSTISESVRIDWINWVKKNIVDNYSLSDSSNIVNWNFLKIWNDIYYLSDWYVSWNYSRVNFSDMQSICTLLKNNCFLVKNQSMLTNSWVALEDLNFTLMWEQKRKLVINFTMRPATKKWIKTSLIKKSKLVFQTTISERFIKTN